MYVIIGANGFLGSYIIKSVLQNTNENIIATARNIQCVKQNSRIKWISCDVSDIISIEELAKEINYGENCKVIYLAAYHHPDMVQKNPKIAWNINITALSYFLNLLSNAKCLFYPSTDTVYGEGSDGHKFCENDLLNPVNLYGKHKVAAECIVTALGYNVVRYPFLIGPSLLDHKEHFHDKIVKTLMMEKPIEMFADSVRSSLDFDTAANLLVQLIENYKEDIPKIVNLSGDDALSKYDVGLMIAKKHGFSTDFVRPISANSSNEIFEVRRALSTLIDNSLIKSILGLNEIKIKL